MAAMVGTVLNGDGSTGRTPGGTGTGNNGYGGDGGQGVDAYGSQH